MKRILTILCVVFAASILLAHTSGTVKKICPLCAFEFDAEMDMSGTQFGVRLDLKPLGPIAAPWRVAVCPKCHFVLFREDLNETEKSTLDAYVRSDAFKELVSDGHSSHFLLAKTISQLKHPKFDIAFAYLKASWQVESTNPKRCQAYLEESLENFRSAINDEGIKDEEELKTATLLTGEILRRLSRFDDAKHHFERLAREAGFGKQPYKTIVRYELELIGAADARPTESPPIVLTQEDKMELPEYKMCYTLNGISAVTNLFSVREASIGHINGLPYSLLVELDPTDKNRNVVNSAWWFNPVDERSQRAVYDWNDFMKCYEEMNGVVSQYGWIMNWRNAGSNRTVQACIFGVRPYTETMLDDLVAPGWKHAGMKGVPEYEIKLRRAGEWCGTIFFGKDENRAFIETIRAGDGEHWLDKQNLSYHPTQDIPEYIIVDQDGKWTGNEKGRQDPNKTPSLADPISSVPFEQSKDHIASFSSMPDALNFIASCVEQNDAGKLTAACVGDRKKPKIYLAENPAVFRMLVAFHNVNDLRKFYGDQRFPEQGAAFKLGGHGKQFHHIHIDFVKKGQRWHLADIWNCK